jgi:hypothetical protein
MTKIILISCLFALAFTGCATKTKIETEYVYKDKYVPVKCNAAIPAKPKNNGTFEADKEKMIYYIKVESLLKECVGAQK